MELMDHQKLAVEQLDTGKVLWGGVGSGKSATAMAYYWEKQRPKHLYIITTAKKRDSLDWEKEAAQYGISDSIFLDDDAYTNHAGILTVDSWNNLHNYVDIEDAFFIFDEQRVVGYGSWVKSFIKIAKRNDWILLSGTPGDTWTDYMPIFVANGWYKNKTDFDRQHVLYEPFRNYPVIRGFLNVTKLEMMRNNVLVEMPYLKHTKPMINWIDVDCDMALFKKAYKERWHIYEDRPIKDVGELFRVLRRLVNSDPSRLEFIKKLMRCHDRLIIFYNFDYELDILRTLNGDIPVYEWNGHRKDHNSTFEGEQRWVYLVQYVAGAEAWNCTTTDAMVLNSLTYSYKNFIQAQGRIDRLDTPYTYLYYYLLLSNTIVDRRIKLAMKEKRNFNERRESAELDKGDVQIG
jgi:hypothetical protein